LLEIRHGAWGERPDYEKTNENLIRARRVMAEMRGEG
jgi:hypothetical protein